MIIRIGNIRGWFHPDLGAFNASDEVELSVSYLGGVKASSGDIINDSENPKGLKSRLLPNDTTIVRIEDYEVKEISRFGADGKPVKASEVSEDDKRGDEPEAKPWEGIPADDILYHDEDGLPAGWLKLRKDGKYNVLVADASVNWGARTITQNKTREGAIASLNEQFATDGSEEQSGGEEQSGDEQKSKDGGGMFNKIVGR